MPQRKKRFQLKDGQITYVLKRDERDHDWYGCSICNNRWFPECTSLEHHYNKAHEGAESYKFELLELRSCEIALPFLRLQTILEQITPSDTNNNMTSNRDRSPHSDRISLGVKSDTGTSFLKASRLKPYEVLTDDFYQRFAALTISPKRDSEIGQSEDASIQTTSFGTASTKEVSKASESVQEPSEKPLKEEAIKPGLNATPTTVVSKDKQTNSSKDKATLQVPKKRGLSGILNGKTTLYAPNGKAPLNVSKSKAPQDVPKGKEPQDIPKRKATLDVPKEKTSMRIQNGNGSQNPSADRDPVDVENVKTLEKAKSKTISVNIVVMDKELEEKPPSTSSDETSLGSMLVKNSEEKSRNANTLEKASMLEAIRKAIKSSQDGEKGASFKQIKMYLVQKSGMDGTKPDKNLRRTLERFVEFKRLNRRFDKGRTLYVLTNKKLSRGEVKRIPREETRRWRDHHLRLLAKALKAH